VDASVPIASDSGTDANPVLRTLLLCGLVDSTGLVERMGDRAAAELIRKHDRLARTIADRHGGREIDKTDGFLMMFERPIQAVAFALDYQRGLRQLNAAEESTLAARVGIHVGDVMIWDNRPEDVAKGAKPTEVEGLVKPITSRLMNLALPNQILLSNIAYVLAHRAQGELGIAQEKVRWRTHGRYRFRGVPDPVPVFEVGEDGVAPLKAPPWSSKAHREVPFWRRPATVVVEGMVVLALLAIPLYSLLKPEPAVAFANRDWVVVGSLNNLTSESVFDDALESALRISLEQSRYVNVLPELKVRDTVKRMQRDPDTTKVDRMVGSEVAIRDGAKALILPTVAEIGGRVRVTAEVIDPHTQATVYSESADGAGAQSVLGSLDTINRKLRVRLGEALTSVTNETMPLEKVATDNLDALRAYSLGQKLGSQGDDDEAIRLLQAAIRIDPGFARARIALAATLFNLDRRTEAADQLEKVRALEDRMAARERMLADAWRANLSSPREALGQWKSLALVYPDLFTAQGTYAFYVWQYANDYAEAIPAARRAAVTHNPHRGMSLYLLATLELGEEQFDSAHTHFAEASTLGVAYENNLPASLHAARREYAEAKRSLAEGRVSRMPSARLDRLLTETAFAVDMSSWNDAERMLGEAGKSGLDAARLRTVESVMLSLQAVTGVPDHVRGVVNSGLRNLAEPPVDEMPNRDEHDARILFDAWLAARHGEPSLARELLLRLDERVRDGANPLLERVLKVVEAAIALREQSANLALERLLPLVDGREPYVTHLALMEAYRAVGDPRAAREQARWLARHRGRVYAETGTGPAWRVYNVAQSTLALLDTAALSLRLGDNDDARKSLQAFMTAWPGWKAAPGPHERANAVDEALRAGSLP